MIVVKQFMPEQALSVPEVETQILQDSRYMKVVLLSALRTGRFRPQENFLVLISVRSSVEPRITRMKVIPSTS
jgi:hypothetical protein